MESNITTKNKSTNLLYCGVLICIAGYLFINPFPHKTAFENLFFYLALLFTIILIAKQKIPFTLKTPLTIPLLLFTAWIIIGIPFAADKTTTIHDIYAH